MPCLKQALKRSVRRSVPVTIAHLIYSTPSYSNKYSVKDTIIVKA
ncbi:hypothetical protein [Candidatus Clavichlamydia salmonicola]|nr:hypothetical protein [Candidatus Clavichlamydia salmonicola]